MKKQTPLFLILLIGTFIGSTGLAQTIHLDGSDGGIVLRGDQPNVETIDSAAGLEIHAKQPNKNEPLYLSLSVEDADFIDGAAPIQKFSFEYFDAGSEEVTFDIDSLDPLHGGPNNPGIWRGAGGFQLMNTGTWKTKTITLHDARFSQRLNGADIRFRALRYPHLRIRNVSLEKLDTPLPLPAATLKQGDVPNILVIIFDDLNDYIGPYGDPNVKTPHLDAFARDALQFDHAYVQYPVCGPSRASFLTGMYPESLGVLDNNSYFRFERPEATNMIEYFKQQGYWTATAGKVFHSAQNYGERGVSTYFGDYFRNAEDPYRKKLNEQFVEEVGPIHQNRAAYNEFMAGRDLSGERIVQAVATDLRDEDHADGRVATRIAAYLNERSFEDRPFFLTAGFMKPHVPFYAPKKYFDLYPIEELQFDDVPVDSWDNRPMEALHTRYEGFQMDFGVNDREARAKWLQAYLATISLVDAQFGRVMQALENSGMADNTIVIAFSDHGFHIGEHFMYGKVSLFEESTRVPFLVRMPGVTKPGVSDSFIELLDIYPTLIELSGLEAPEHLQGVSLLPIFEDPEAIIKDSAYTVVSRPGGLLGRSVRYDNWRYTEWGSPSKNELYDLDRDPNEYDNLANSPEYRDVVEKLSELIDLLKQR